MSENIWFLLTIHNRNVRFQWRLFYCCETCVLNKRILFHKLESNDNFVYILRSFCLASFWTPPMSLPRKKIAGDSENRWDLAIFLLILYFSFPGKHRGTKLNENCKIRYFQAIYKFSRDQNWKCKEYQGFKFRKKIWRAQK